MFEDFSRLRFPLRLWQYLVAFVALGAGAALVYYKVRIAISVGPGWDTYAFLSNAAEFAGRGFGYTEAHRPPFLSFVVSLLFRAGSMTDDAIQWVDGAITYGGIVALYLLLRRRFQPVAAAAGALAMLGVQPLWAYLGVGYTDASSVALSLWTILALMYATEHSKWWYLAAGPLFVAAALTRFTALLFIFPCVVWMFLRWRPFAHARAVLLGALLSVVAYVPAALYYQHRFADSLFPFLVAFTFNEDVSTPMARAGVGSGGASWYLRQFPAFLAPGQLLPVIVTVLFVGLIGVLWACSAHLTRSRPGNARLSAAAMAIGAGIIAEIAGGLMLRQVAIPVVALVVWRLLGTRETPLAAEGDVEEAATARVTADGAMDAAMVVWLLTYLDFHGHQSVTVARYFIVMAPPTIYFVLRGWTIAAEEIAQRIESAKAADRPGMIRLWMVAAVSALLFTAVAVGCWTTSVHTPTTPDPYVAGARKSAKWLLANEPRVKQKTIYSDVWPLMSWYLGMNVIAMPPFTEGEAYAHQLDKYVADYFVTLRARRFKTYAKAYDAKKVVVLKRKSDVVPELPRVLYLGKSWDNYLESLDGYRVYLDSTAGRYGWEGSAFLDAYPASKLASADLVAACGVRWRSRSDAERALEDYLRAGGSVVIDASQNLGGLAYAMGDTIMFDTVVRRGKVPKDASFELDPAFAAAHPEVPAMQASTFVDETGGAWGGAVYDARPGTPPLKTLVSAGGIPVVQTRDVGRGRIYWVGLNLFWHAFSKQNPTEARLVDAILQDAITRAREARAVAGKKGA